MKDSKIRNTGIPQLDNFLDGGFPEGKSIIFYTSPGVENDVFGYQILAQKDGYKKFCFINTIVPDLMKKAISNYGWEIGNSLTSGDMFIIDACSYGIGMPGKGKYIIENNTPEEIDTAITKSINEIKSGTGVINSFSTIVDSVGEKNALQLIAKWNSLALKNKVNLIYLFTVWAYPEDFLKKLKEEMNCVISVSGIEKRVIIGQYFAVMKADWMKAKAVSVLFQVSRPGGVKVFIPKILITGPYNSGKSSFMHSLATKAVSVDRHALEEIPTTIALDIGHIDYNSFSADLFGTPGQERFDLLLAPLGKEAVGAFVILDSTRPETFPRAKEMVRKCNVGGLPKVIVANKQNVKGALTLEQIRKELKLTGDVKIVPLRAAKGIKFPLKEEPCPLNKDDCINALKELINQIYQG